MRRLLLFIVLVVPCEARLDLFESDIDRIAASFRRAFGREHTSYDAAVAVAFGPRDAHRLSMNQRGEMLFRSVAVRLTAFGRIDAGEAHFHVLPRFDEDRERITVGDGNDFAEKLRCTGTARGEQKRECNAG